MLSENEYKIKLIDSLNSRNNGWVNGDAEPGNTKKCDLINSRLKIAIEIKDDTQFEMPIPESGQVSGFLLDVTKKNRQFKDDMKDASNKFKNYPGYKTILLLRTQTLLLGPEFFKYCSNGPINIDSAGNRSRPSSYFMEHDHSTSEVGCIFQVSDQNYSYAENPNPNVSNVRKISKNDLEKILGIRIND